MKRPKIWTKFEKRINPMSPWIVVSEDELVEYFESLNFIVRKNVIIDQLNGKLWYQGVPLKIKK